MPSWIFVFIRLLPSLLRAILALEKAGLEIEAEYLIAGAINASVDEAVAAATAARSAVKDDPISIATDPDNRDTQ